MGVALGMARMVSCTGGQGFPRKPRRSFEQSLVGVEWYM